MSRLRRTLAAVSIIAVGALLPGCFQVGEGEDDDSADDDSCETDDDCRSNQFCNSDDECERRDSEPEPEPGSECNDDGDCLSGELCNAAGECQSQCGTFCDWSSRCSTEPANCPSSCTTVLEDAPAPCSTSFALFIECVATVDAACSAVTQTCRDEAEIFTTSCTSE